MSHPRRSDRTPTPRQRWRSHCARPRRWAWYVTIARLRRGVAAAVAVRHVQGRPGGGGRPVWEALTVSPWVSPRERGTGYTTPPPMSPKGGVNPLHEAIYSRINGRYLHGTLMLAMLASLGWVGKRLQRAGGVASPRGASLLATRASRNHGAFRVCARPGVYSLVGRNVPTPGASRSYV